jgi:hypothetical protein
MPMLSQRTVLTIGVKNPKTVPHNLPVNFLNTPDSREAIPVLRRTGVHGIVVQWNRFDQREKEFIRKVKLAHPSIPVIVLLDEPDDMSEILIRSLGVVAVLSADSEGSALQQILEQVLQIRSFPYAERIMNHLN